MMHMLVVVVGIYHCGVVARNALLRTLDEVKQFENLPLTEVPWICNVTTTQA